MNIGIIGHEAGKFTGPTKANALIKISDIIAAHPDPVVVSGRCPLGGVDVWAEEMADSLGIKKLIFPPAKPQWEGGYKPRNIEIATWSEIVYVIVVGTLPPGYPIEPWNRGPCYHCYKRKFPNSRAELFNLKHVKSGACWTAWYAIEKLGKEARWVII